MEEVITYEWEVLLNYPGSPFQVGQKVTAYENGAIGGIEYDYDGYGPYRDQIDMNEYPHIFKRLNDIKKTPAY